MADDYDTNSAPSLKLELGPIRHVPPGMREAILHALDQAGLRKRVWTPLAGDPSGDDDKRVADPMLHIVLTASAEHPADVVLAASNRLAVACERIRRACPRLPLGLVIHSPEGTTRYCWRPSDTPSALRRSLATVPTPDELDQLGKVIGWDDATSRWIAL